MTYLNSSDPKYDNKSDAIVIPGVETETARNLNEIGPNEISRESHNEGYYIFVPTPTSTGYTIETTKPIE